MTLLRPALALLGFAAIGFMFGMAYVAGLQ